MHENIHETCLTSPKGFPKRAAASETPSKLYAKGILVLVVEYLTTNSIMKFTITLPVQYCTGHC